MDKDTQKQLIDWAETYNDPVYFSCDPIIFPKEFLSRGASLRDVEIAAVFAAHFAWGRRAMIVRDCERFFDYIEWKPADYVMSGSWRDDPTSIHRTIKWSDTARICANLKDFYGTHSSLEELDSAGMRVRIYGSTPDPKAANKKIHMMRRWMVRRDGRVDLGLWRGTPLSSLVIPLDVHVYDTAAALGLTSRKSKDFTTAAQITDCFREVFPDDPVKGDFSLFGYGVTHQGK